MCYVGEAFPNSYHRVLDGGGSRGEGEHVSLEDGGGGAHSPGSGSGEGLVGVHVDAPTLGDAVATGRGINVSDARKELISLGVSEADLEGESCDCRRCSPAD